jgi:hypothetical protein
MTLAAVAALAVAGAPVAADTVSDVRVAVDARTAGDVQIAYELGWKVTEPRTSLRVHLAKELEVSAVESGGKPLTVSAAEVPGTGLRFWDVQLPAKLAAGKSVPLRVRARIASSARADLRVGGGGGALLPGSGWFPQADPTFEAGVAHTTTFALPTGLTGIAAGTRQPDGSWRSETPARPYAVWGALQSTAAEGHGADGAPVAFEVWRPTGAAGAPRDLDVIAGLIRAVEIGVGPARGTGSWKLIDAGVAPSGGARTLFWDGQGGASGKDEAALLRGRDLAGAVATAHWTESAEFQGEFAAFLSRGLALQLGDIGYTAWAESRGSRGVEPVTVRARRDAFATAPDRALAGLSPLSPDAGALLATRGALVAHQLAGFFSADRARWLLHLRTFRDANASGFGWDAFRGTFREGLAAEIEPLLRTTDLPDFRIVSHEAKKTEMGGTRLYVIVENRGKARGWALVTTYDASGEGIYETRAAIDPGEKKTFAFGDPDRVARVVVDPTGVMPQRDLAGEVVQIKNAGGAAAKVVRSYPIEVHASGPRQVHGFRLQLTDARIEGFDGWIVPYATEQGPSGACLVGKGTLILSPGESFAPSWTAKMGTGTVTVPDAAEIWVRFPLDAWKQIEPQLGAPVAQENRQQVMDRQHWIHSFSFPAYFADRDRAQIPPPGSTVVVFTEAGRERKGFARIPDADGTVLERLWDHRTSKTLWEQRR